VYGGEMEWLSVARRKSSVTPIDEQIAHRRFEPCVGLAAWDNMRSPPQIVVRSWQRQPLDMGGSIECK
jgi:hypothetical protein